MKVSIINNNNSNQEYYSSDEETVSNKRPASDGEESVEKRLKTEPTSESEWSIPEELKEGILALIEDIKGPFPLERLTDDIIAEVLSHLDIPELDAIKTSNKRLNQLLNYNFVWEKVARKINFPISKDLTKNILEQIQDHRKQIIKDLDYFKPTFQHPENLLIQKDIDEIISIKTIESFSLLNQFHHSCSRFDFFQNVQMIPVFSEERIKLPEISKKPKLLTFNSIQEVISTAHKTREWLEEHVAILSSSLEGMDSLQDRKIFPYIPPEISQFTSLTELSLVHTDINSLSPEIGKLISLVSLNLTGNNLTSIPLEIRKLTSLHNLYLGGNKLNIFPPLICKMASLEDLDLWGNQITTIPPEIIKLSQLEELGLDINDITIIPPEIFQMPSLKRLQLKNNQITVIPPEIFKSSLIRCNLKHNQITHFPCDNLAGRSSKMRVLLRGNPVTIISHNFEIDMEEHDSEGSE